MTTIQPPTTPPSGEYRPVSGQEAIDIVSSLPIYDGIRFDRSTGKTYFYRTPEGLLGEDEPRNTLVASPYTFEAATWTGVFGAHFQWPWLNALGFATRETAEMVLAECKAWVAGAIAADRPVAVEMDETNRIVGPFTRTVERLIVVGSVSGNRAEHSAGRIAASIMRNGRAAAGQLFVAELRRSGVL